MKKKEQDAQISKWAVVGLIIFLIINGSLLFLFIHPILPNYLEKMLDDQFLAEVDGRIRDVRTDSITFQLIYTNGTALRDAQVEIELMNHNFFFGCNLYKLNQTGTPAGDQLYGAYFQNLFNLATIPFYWRQYEPAQGDFPKDDWINDSITWCRTHNITTKGHPLAWRDQAGYPDWLPDDDRKVEELLEARINRIVEMYKGRMDIWDVVNEPTHLPDFGGWDTIEYLSNCFTWADSIDSGASLTLNDYGILGHDFGYGPYARLIERALTEEIPIDRIGLQGREPRLDWIPAREIWATLEEYRKFDLPIHITEFTCPSSGLPITNSWKKGTWTEANQAEYAKRMYKIAFSHPSVEGIIWWDLWDGGAWVQNGGLLNEKFEPKLVYETLDSLINQKWHTEKTGWTDSEGTLTFNGFYGRYNVSVPSEAYVTQFTAEKGEPVTFSLEI